MPSTCFPHHPALRLIQAVRSGDVIRLDAGAIVDGHDTNLAPGSLLLRVDRAVSDMVPLAIETEVLAVDAPASVDSYPAASSALRIDLHDSVLLPALVNAHAHLDLTHIGPRPLDPDQGFVAWIDHVRRHRPVVSDKIEASVREGIALSLAGGTVAIGDIGGAPEGRPSLVSYRTLVASPLLGVSFLEFFAMGTREHASLDRTGRILDEGLALNTPGSGIRLGLQPHAPYSASLGAYRWAQEAASKHGLAIATHLAETGEEREFVEHGTGPQREFLERLGLWDSSVSAQVGQGLDPVAHLGEILALAPMTCVHVNDADDAAISTLARAGASAVYCPRASSYFAAERVFGPHRYRDMLDAGVNVALGTDSIINLPQDARKPDRGISIWDEMRLLYSRDRVDPQRLLAMATTGGASALALDPARFRFDIGSSLAGVVRIDLPTEGHQNSLRAALESDTPISLLFHGNCSGLTGKTAL